MAVELILSSQAKTVDTYIVGSAKPTGLIYNSLAVSVIRNIVHAILRCYAVEGAALMVQGA